MRKFIIIFVLIVVFIVALMFSEFSVNMGLYRQCNLSDKQEVLNFGFVEQYFGTKSCFYKQNGLVVGEFIKIDGFENLGKLCDCLGLKVDKKYNVSGIDIIEGYSALSQYKLPVSVNNIQIAMKDNVIIVGSPIIYGGY